MHQNFAKKPAIHSVLTQEKIEMASVRWTGERDGELPVSWDRVVLAVRGSNACCRPDQLDHWTERLQEFLDDRMEIAQLLCCLP